MSEKLTRFAAIFSYNPATGEFHRLTAGHHAETPGWLSDKGYRLLGLGRERVRAHHLAWFIMTGQSVPPGLVLDHVNLDRSDNRWDNLRIATPSQNQHNRKAQINNRLGCKGVRRVGRKFRVEITVAGAWKYLGTYSTLDAADAAYRDASSSLVGEFARSA